MATEYQFLFDLSVNAGLVLTHDQLLRRVWGSGAGRSAGAAREPEAAPPQAGRGR